MPRCYDENTNRGFYAEKYIEHCEYQNSDEDAPTVTKLIQLTISFTNVKTQLMAFNRTWRYHRHGHLQKLLTKLLLNVYMQRIKIILDIVQYRILDIVQYQKML